MSVIYHLKIMERFSKKNLGENKQFHVWLTFHSNPLFIRVYCNKHRLSPLI